VIERIWVRMRQKRTERSIVKLCNAGASTSKGFKPTIMYAYQVRRQRSEKTDVTWLKKEEHDHWKKVFIQEKSETVRGNNGKWVGRETWRRTSAIKKKKKYVTGIPLGHRHPHALEETTKAEFEDITSARQLKEEVERDKTSSSNRTTR